MPYLIFLSYREADSLRDKMSSTEYLTIVLRTDESVGFSAEEIVYLAADAQVHDVALVGPISAAAPPLGATAETTVSSFGVRFVKGAGLRLTAGRVPEAANEVISTAEALRKLRIDGIAGTYVTSGARHLYFVGRYVPATPAGPLRDLLAAAIIRPTLEPSINPRLVFVTVTSANALQPVVDALRSLITLPPTRYSIDYRSDAAAIGALISSSARSSSRSTGLGAVGAAATSVGLLSLLTTILQRREVARRRALGLSRVRVARVLIAEASLVSLIGATAGSGIFLLGAGWPPTMVPLGLAAKSACLMTLLASLMAAPAAWLGSRVDPARTLRVP